MRKADDTLERPGGWLISLVAFLGVFFLSPHVSAAGSSLVLEGETVEVPGVVGKGLEEAAGILAAVGLKLGEVRHQPSDQNPGTVVGQSPEAGSELPVGTAVHLVVSSGPEEPKETTVVPHVIGKGLEQASGILADAGLKLGEVGHEASDQEPGMVLWQHPEAGSEVHVGTAVHLILSSGPEEPRETVEVPGVVGKGLEEAAGILAAVGLKLGEVGHEASEQEPGMVLWQRPEAGGLVPVGTAVHLVVSSGTEEREETVEVPNVVGKGLEQAAGELARAGLKVGEVGREASDQEPGTVIRQYPEAGAAVGTGTAVHLVVASGTVETAPVSAITREGNKVLLTWEPFGSRRYKVQWTDDLASGIWRDASGPITDTSWRSEYLIGIGKRHYRVISQ